MHGKLHMYMCVCIYVHMCISDKRSIRCQNSYSVTLFPTLISFSRIVSSHPPPFHTHIYSVSFIASLHSSISHILPPPPRSLASQCSVYMLIAAVYRDIEIFVRALTQTCTLMPVHMPADLCFHTCVFSHTPACRAAEREMHNGGFKR